MKRLFALILSLILSLSLCACSQDTQPQDESKLQVMASCFPYYDFARAIGGEHIEPALLIAAGREVHSFEPTPLDVVRLSECDVFLYNGGESELWVEEILESAGENITVTAAMMEHAPLLAEEFVEGMETSVHHHHHHEEEGEEHHHDHEEEELAYDEHVWTSPVVAQDLCRAICEALCTADPAHREDYEANLAAYLGELQALDEAFRSVIAEGKRTTLVFGDRFPMRYLCDAYGLGYRAAFPGCAAESEPSAATMIFLIEKVKEEGIPAILTIEMSNRKIAQTISEETGAPILMIHSCHNRTADEAAADKTYLDLMYENARVLSIALGQRNE